MVISASLLAWNSRKAPSVQSRDTADKIRRYGRRRHGRRAFFPACPIAARPRLGAFLWCCYRHVLAWQVNTLWGRNKIKHQRLRKGSTTMQVGHNSCSKIKRWPALGSQFLLHGSRAHAGSFRRLSDALSEIWK